MALAESDRRPNTEQVRSWLRNVDALTKILNRYRDKESLQQLTQQRQTLGDLLDALGLDGKGRDKTRMCLFSILSHAAC
jgi:chorismate-pyruvate lyase